MPLPVPNLSAFWEGIFVPTAVVQIFLSLPPTALKGYLVRKYPQLNWKAQPLNSSQNIES